MKTFIQMVLWGVVFSMTQMISVPIVEGSNDKSQSATIHVKNGLLTASVKEVPLIDILGKLAEQTGIGFELYAETDRMVSARYSRIPLEDGLRRLLRPSNYIILYMDKKSSSKPADIKKIIIYDVPGTNGNRGIKQQASRSKMSNENNMAGMNPNQQSDTKKTLKYYAAQMNEPDPDDREEAISDMAGEYNEAALSHLERVLIIDGNEDVRAAAAWEIGELANESGIDILSKGLNDPDETVRESVVEALGEIGGNMALPLLREALKDGNEDIRLVAAALIDEIEKDDDKMNF